MKKIIILGSTGSIGTQTLDVIRAHRDEFEVVGLSAHENKALFESQCEEFRPKHALLSSESKDTQGDLCALARMTEAQIVVNALSGMSGVMPSLAACEAPRRLALANKESLVMAGELVMEAAGKNGTEIVPIDSEPAAIWQALPHEGKNYAGQNPSIEKIILTASGGPFWGQKKEQLQNVTRDQALKHPTWKMGEKISIDSATFMNKAFEVIEVARLFGLPPAKIQVVVHRQSVVHSLVQYSDANVLAVMSPPDMRVHIAYALFYPHRPKNKLPRLDFSHLTLTFEDPDDTIFKGPQLAHTVLKTGGTAPAIFAYADEVAVGRFLAGTLSFLDIYDFIENALKRIPVRALTRESLAEIPSFFV